MPEGIGEIPEFKPETGPVKSARISNNPEFATDRSESISETASASTMTPIDGDKIKALTEELKPKAPDSMIQGINEEDAATRRQQARDRAKRGIDSTRRKRRMAFILTPLVTVASFVAVHVGLNRQEEVDKKNDAEIKQAVFTDQQDEMSRKVEVNVGEGGNVHQATVSDGTKYSTDAAGQERNQGN